MGQYSKAWYLLPNMNALLWCYMNLSSLIDILGQPTQMYSIKLQKEIRNCCDRNIWSNLMFYQLRSVCSFPLPNLYHYHWTDAPFHQRIKGTVNVCDFLCWIIIHSFQQQLIEIQSDSTYPGLDRLDLFLMSEEHNLLDFQSSISYDCPSEVKWKGALVVV